MVSTKSKWRENLKNLNSESNFIYITYMSANSEEFWPYQFEYIWNDDCE